MQVREVMTHQVESVRSDATLQEAARKMRSLDVGALPVTDGSRIIGMITDRDITIRATATGADPTRTPVRDACSSGVVYCYEEDDVRNVARLMRDHQLRRIPVVNRGKKLVGIIALKDLALETGDERMAGDVVQGVSRETEQSMMQRGAMMSGERGRGYERGEMYGREPSRGMPDATTASGGWAEPSRSSGSRFDSARGPHAGRGPRGYRRSDERIREDICEHLTMAPNVDPSEMDIEVRGGEVLLTGMVEDPAMRREAERIAQQCPGVTRVQNELRPRRGDEWAASSGENNIGRNAATRM